MTTIAAPPRRGRSTTTLAPARARRAAPTRAKAGARTETRAETRPLAIGRLGGVLAVVTVLALVAAVVFHVFLAQNQMALDHLNVQITKEQRTYEQRRYVASFLASPQIVIQEAERLGLVMPAEPAQTLFVDGAPMPKTNDGSTADTLGDWSKTKPSLGAPQS